ncbi:Hypothetical protein BSPT1_II0654 [Brucella suis bv. 2]|nr:Hypothetical protein BSPT1_II0654 [Brucella suis bv. 2]
MSVGSGKPSVFEAGIDGLASVSANGPGECLKPNLRICYQRQRIMLGSVIGLYI